MNFTFDEARGREVELYKRVDTNDPANSAFVIVVLNYTGLQTDNTLKAYATLATLLAANPEVTNSGYARKTVTDADLATYTVDYSAHSTTLYLPEQTYVGIGVGDFWGKAVVAYDSDTTAGTDSDIIPVTAQDIRLNSAPIAPNGGDIQFSWPTGLLVA